MIEAVLQRGVAAAKSAKDLFLEAQPNTYDIQNVIQIFDLVAQISL